MTIVFGSGSFLLKKFKPEDVGLEEKVQQGYMVERRQSFVHIFWIPISATGKVWYVSNNSERYKLPTRYEHLIIKNNVKTKGKWYAYLLPLLILLVALGAACFFVLERYMSYRRQMAERAEEQRVFENPSTNDSYRFSDANYKDFVLKIKTVKPNQIVFNAPVLRDSLSYGERRFYNDSTQTIILNRSDLKKLFAWKYIKYKDPGTLKLSTLKPLTIEQVKLYNVRRQKNNFY